MLCRYTAANTPIIGGCTANNCHTLARAEENVSSVQARGCILLVKYQIGRNAYLFKPWGEPSAGLVKIKQAQGLMGYAIRRATDADIPIGVNIKPLIALTREVPDAITYTSGAIANRKDSGD